MQRPNRRGTARKAPNSLTRIPIRLNILLGLVIVMLIALGAQLMNLQIRNHEKFVAEISSGTQSVEKEKVQRGMIYDTTGKVLVANKGSQAVMYTKPKNISEQKMYQVANEVAKNIQIDTAQLSKSAAASYYLQNAKRSALVAKHIKNIAVEGTDERVRQLTQYLMKHDDQIVLSDAQKNAAMIYQKMNNAYALSTVYLKETDVSAAEVAKIGERQSAMPGVKVGLYYTRDYPNGTGMQSVIGSVSTSKAGLPDSKVNTLLTQGYARDDSVGTSYLEQFYESSLRGTKKEISVSTDGKTGETTTAVKNAGQAGDSLHLTINAKFQEDVQKILNEKMPGGLTQGAYAVVINPKTGGLYAMGGVYRDNQTGKKTDDALGNINRAQVVGSAVKPAMITTAFMNNVITPQNSNITDVPIQIAATPKKASWFNQNGAVPLTAQTALQNSSNSYVMQLMLKMGGQVIIPTCP
ncbi:penicillin-binding transpeptidase domain-containing protein [Weissella diestrammenae]|uniref:penicillin-binding transpeptidase domain-containing protein n=1 Tax=Weissella diestrammenae TaxID=1162633 RepID=UPI0023ED4D48|nr:penicillin-binding transpeptidase domain-containing protein [Weissella diestrammenae]